MPLFLLAVSRGDSSGCVSFGYPAGRWGIAAGPPAHEVAYRNSWGTGLGLQIPGPLRPGAS